MSVHKTTRGYLVPEHQAAATLNQAAPVQNTWYTILATNKNVRVYGIAFGVATTGEDLECRVTIDGQVLTATQAGVADTTYYFAIRADPLYGMVASAAVNSICPGGFYAALEGRSIKVEVRKTSTNGAGNLKGGVVYGKW